MNYMNQSNTSTYIEKEINKNNIYERYPVGTTYYDNVGLDPNKFMPNSKWKLIFTFGPLNLSKNLQKIYLRIE